MKIEYLCSLGNFSTPFKKLPDTVCVDSRNIESGGLFFALPGEKVDGHLYLSDVIEKGAAGAVIRADFSGDLPSTFPVMRVQNPLATLQKFAQIAVEKNGSKVCAVTGSIGKTTTKDFIATILSLTKKIASTPGSQNSQIGLCLSLLNLLQGTEEWIIAEMGMSHAGDITALTAVAPPDIALITSVHLVHAENFPSLASIAEAKTEIFAKENTKICLFNADTNETDVLLKRAKGREKTFSMQDEKAYWSMVVKEKELLFKEDGKEYILPKPLFPAPHVYENLLAAISACRAMQVSFDAISMALPLLRLPDLRLERVTCRGIHFINDSFNACEQSMIAALNVLKASSGKRKIAVLGAMKELGVFSEECHRRVLEKACQTADMVYTLGQEWRPFVKKENKCEVSSSLEELIFLLDRNLREDDSVLLKGSRWANQLWKVVDHFRLG